MDHRNRSRETRPRNRSLGAIMVLLVVAFAAGRSLASEIGPIDNVAGNPPAYLDCTLCHDTYPANSGDGGIALLNLPAAFVPGTAYDLALQIDDPGQLHWGFELTVLGSSNEQAGDLVVLSPGETQLSDNPGTEADFLKQTDAGGHEHLPGPIVWPFRWIAPGLSSVTFYFAGVAGDLSFDPSGDYVYVQQRSLSQAPTGVESGSWGRIKALYSGR